MQVQKIRNFDIVLVLDYFRSAGPYLCIIKYLAKEFSIGVYQTAVANDLFKKNQNAQEQFLGECRRLGAVLIDDDPVSTYVMVVQQRPYVDEVVAEILEHIQAHRCVALLTLAMSGIDVHDHFLHQFNIDRFYVPNLRFFEFLLEKRNAKSAYVGRKIKQVGLPYGCYPLVAEFYADYLLAVPTQFSFPNEKAKQRFLETVLKLFEQIDEDALVVYKPHNGVGYDSLAPRGYTQLGSFLSLLPFSDFVLRMIKRFSPNFILFHIEKIRTGLLYAKMIRRVTPLAEITPYSSFQLEIFLPWVRKGVIGGLSNTIWSTLYFGLPFYNCVDRDWRKKYKGAGRMSGKDPGNLLDLNLQFFGVPFCNGDLSQGIWGEIIVGDEDRRGDLIEMLRFDIDAARASRR